MLTPLSRALRYAILGSLPLYWGCTPNTTPTKATTPEYSYTSPSTGNVAHDHFLKLTPDFRALALAQIVVGSGDMCTGTTTFFMGMNLMDNDAYWSVRCTNGKSYQIRIKADDGGSTSVLDCDVLKLAKVSCFQKLN